jgi:hypothetical protein
LKRIHSTEGSYGKDTEGATIVSREFSGYRRSNNARLNWDRSFRKLTEISIGLVLIFPRITPSVDRFSSWWTSIIILFAKFIAELRDRQNLPKAMRLHQIAARPPEVK